MFFLVLTTFAFAKDYNASVVREFNFGIINCSLSCFLLSPNPKAEVVIEIQSIDETPLPEYVYLSFPQSFFINSSNGNTILVNNVTVENATIENGLYRVSTASDIVITAFLDGQAQSSNLKGFFIGQLPISILDMGGALEDTFNIVADASFVQLKVFNNVQDLNFGTITNSPSGSCYVTITTAASYTTNCPSVEGYTTPGIISTTHDTTNPIIGISVPTNIALTNSAGNVIYITNFTHSISAAFLDGDPVNIYLGATLNTATEAGVYTGIIPITINY